jgi:hypothetical protein
VKRSALFVLASLVLVGCQAPAVQTETEQDEGGGTGRVTEPALVQVFDGWTIEISLAPGTVGPLVLEVGPLRAAPSSDSRPWIQHDLEFHNRGDRPVRFEDTRTSVFLRRAGRNRLLVADEGCGYGKPGAVEPGACLLYLDAFVVRPGSTARRTVTLFKELGGMAPLTPGIYVWEKVIRFRVGSPRSPVRTAVISLTYEVRAAG